MPPQDCLHHTGRRRRALPALAVAVGMLHVGLLLTPAPPQPPLPGWPARAAPVLVQRVAAQDSQGVAPAATPSAAAPPARTAVAPQRSRPVASPDRPAASLDVAPAQASDPMTGPATRADAQPATEEAEPALPGATPPPLYATALPAPVLLHYRLQRGALSGLATLSWLPQGGRYEMQLDALALGRPLIEQRSRGVLDATGVAPERFVDRRRARSAQAANFQRDSGRITFSGPSVEHPAWPGAQDRLGWIAQLAAIQAAAAQPLPEVTLFVVGARGGAGLWTFRALGRETLATPFGSFEALHYERRPAIAEDLQVDVWLDPARGYWPLRLRSVPARGGEALELLLAAEPSVP